MSERASTPKAHSCMCLLFMQVLIENACYSFTVNEHKIKMYLILNKNSMEKTKEKLDHYYTIKTMVPEYFDDRDPTSKSLQQSMDTTYVLINLRA